VTQVAFHTGVPDKLGYACRLLRKAARQGARVLVAGSPDELARLDQMLWIFEHEEFVPHVRLRRGEQLAAMLRRTPVWLAEDGSIDCDATVLVNLGPEAAERFERFERVIEVVSTDAADVQAGRARWRRFVEQGVGPVNLPYGGQAG